MQISTFLDAQQIVGVARIIYDIFVMRKLYMAHRTIRKYISYGIEQNFQPR